MKIETIVENAINSDKSILYFSAPWCGPCKSLAPKVEAFAKANPDVIVVKIDADEQPNISAKHNVRNVPTIIAFKNGVVHKRQVGNVSSIDSLLE